MQIDRQKNTDLINGTEYKWDSLIGCSHENLAMSKRTHTQFPKAN